MRAHLLKLGAALASLALMTGAAALLEPWRGSPEAEREAAWVRALEDHELRVHVEVVHSSDRADALRSCPPERGAAACEAMLRASEARARGVRAEPAPSQGWSGVSGRLRARRAGAIAGALAVVAALAAFPNGRRRLARIWVAPLAGVLWAAAALAAGIAFAAVAQALGAGEVGLALLWPGLFLAPWLAIIGAARSCGRGLPEAPVRAFSAATLLGGAAIAPLGAWLGVPLRPVEVYVLTVIVAAVLATAAGAAAAAIGAPAQPPAPDLEHAR